MTRQEGNRFREIELNLLRTREANKSKSLRDDLKGRNLTLIQMYMEDLFSTILEESNTQEKPIGRDDV